MTPDPVPRELYGRLIDYAGLFPPAELDVTEAVADYQRARQGTAAWMLGPFLLPASRLANPIDVDDLGVVVDGPMPQAHPRLRQLEVRLRAGDASDALTAFGRHAPVVYIEGEPSDPGAIVELAAGARGRGEDIRAKIRTGGPTPEAIPSVDAVGEFVRRCVATSVPFKATAGLHQAVRSPTGPAGATEHGFVNLLAAVRVAAAGGPVEACLADEDPASFRSADAVWRDVGADLSPEEVRATFASFGSCSFSEPVASLQRLGGWAPATSGRT